MAGWRRRVRRRTHRLHAHRQHLIGYSGGGAFDSTLNNCTLTGNTADGDGGGASYGELHNCLLTGNFASEGGGISYATLYNCTIIGNDAYYRGGGAIDSEIYNCIVWGNTTTSEEDPNHSDCYFVHSCTSPLPDDGEGNIDDDPLFADAANGDYRLTPGSPCINAGLNKLVYRTTDLDGNPRIIGTAVDMGAYESSDPGQPPSNAYELWLADNGLTDTPENYAKWLINPADLNAVLTAHIEMVDGAPVITWPPDLGAARVYTIEGKESLTDQSWTPIPPQALPTTPARFFQVRVQAVP